MRPLWVIGAGGHAKVVIDTVRAAGEFDVAGVLDDDRRLWGGEVLGVSIPAGLSDESVARFGIERAIIAIGSNRVRAEIAGRFAGRLAWAGAVHPAATVAPGVRIGEGTVILAGAVVQPDTVIGRHAILNTACSVDHDGDVGDFVHIAPGVHLAGNVVLKEGAFLGIGSVVVPGRRVGAWATIGAGGVVVRDIPDGVTAKGIPATFGVG